jgi:hypothetical protein
VVAVNDGQVTVEHDDVVRRLLGGFHGRGAVAHGVHRHPRLTEPLSDPAGKGHMILDNQYPHPAKYAPVDVTFVRHRA